MAETAPGVDRSPEAGGAAGRTAGSPANEPRRRGGAGRDQRWLSAVGVLSAVVIAVCANVLVARFYQRWDWTGRGLYTLSPATRETLRGLERPVEVIVFLSSSDPLTLSVRHLLETYGAETTYLTTRFVDPDRAPAEFLALQQKYGIVAGKTDDGRVLTDASVVVAAGDRHWFVTSDELVVFDDQAGRAKPRLEQALTGAIRNVLDREKATVCFTTGHQELSIDSGGPTGLAELRLRLEKSNYTATAVQLARTHRLPGLQQCALLVIAAPEQAFSERTARHIRTYLESGGSVLILADPMLGEDERIEATGLEPVASLGGIEFGNDFIIERDSSLRLADGIGEAYFATPRQHAITRGLAQGDPALLRPLLSVSQSLRVAPEGPAQALVVTSDQAFAVRDVRPFMREGRPAKPRVRDPRGPFTVAAAAELKRPPGSKAAHGSRLVVVGSSNVAWSRNWRDPTALGNRLLMESAISWLAARPTMVSVPDKPSHDVGLSLTEESLGEVMRYVLLYMPGSAAVLGLFVILRRRARERRSRRRSNGAARVRARPGRQSGPDAATPRAPSSDAPEERE